jgi:NAD-dependent SIR2 family protein deacetylase
MVAEAMHKASVMKCNKCKTEFEKERHNQCNQIRCLACGSYQCYLCSATISSDHSHFRGKGLRGTCELYGDPQLGARAEKAKKIAVDNLVQAVPGLKVSDFRV